MTWAYNTHCHHCQLDMRAFDRRRAWRSMRAAKYLLVGLVVVGAMSFASMSHGAELEIVPYKPQGKATPAVAVNKAAAQAFARELDALGSALPGTLITRDRWPSLTARMNGLRARGQQLFGDTKLGSPFASCNVAADNLTIAWQASMAMLNRAQQPDVAAVSSLFRYSVTYGDAQRSCRSDVNALPG